MGLSLTSNTTETPLVSTGSTPDDPVMPNPLLLAVALISAVPAPQDPPPRVLLQLVGGGELEGEIQQQTEGYIELRLADGTVVGFDRARIESMADAPVAAAPVPVALDPRDEWFAVHDAEGRVVGRLQSTVTATEDGLLRIGEEWEFRYGTRTTAVTILETASADLVPLACFYHERSTAADGRVLQERLVRGEVVGDELVVDSHGARPRQRRRHPWRTGMQFPLIVAAAMRQNHGELRDERVVRLFVPEREEFVERAVYPASRREVEIDGVRRTVVELCTAPGPASTGNTEWVDASARVLRREVNGAQLVAVAASEAAVRRLMAFEDSTYPSALAAEAEGRFALWLPNPAWQAATAPPGGVLLQVPGRGVSACLLAFDQIDRQLMLESAADTVVRWLAHVRPAMQEMGRRVTTLRDRPAVCIDVDYEDDRAGAHHRFRCQVWVFRVGEATMAFCCDAPRDAFEAFARDFERIRTSAELYPKGFRPARDAELVGGPAAALDALIAAGAATNEDTRRDSSGARDSSAPGRPR